MFSKFWTDVINTWVDMNKTVIKQTNNILHNSIYAEPLFNNQQILYKGQSLCYRHWLNNGVLYFKDICTEGRLITFTELKKKIKDHPCLIFEYNALVNAIPKSWLDFIRDTPTPTEIEINNKDKLDILDTSNTKLRTIISGVKENEICGKNFWEYKTGLDINPFYKMAKEAIKESKLILLHFKILHNIYPSNILLNRMGIKDSELCEICREKDFY